MALAIMLHSARTGSMPDILRSLETAIRGRLRPLRRLATGVVSSLALTASAYATGCASAPAPGGTTPVEEAQPADLEAEVERREREQAQAERLRELEAQLALARAEAAELRARSGPGQVPSDTVRIGGEDASDAASLFDDSDTGEWEVPAEHLPEEESEAGGPQAGRTVLRLYGERPSEPDPATLGDPSFASVAGIDVRQPELRLATAPVPAAPDPGSPPWVAGAGVTPSNGTPPPPARPTLDPGREAYERALGLFQERKVEEAARELRRMLASHPGHALASRARYWLAESLYIQRRYDDARGVFEAFVRGAPRSAKVPDALLKIGLCHQRSGDDAAANRVFARLRSEHPGSVAARTAVRSGS